MDGRVEWIGQQMEWHFAVVEMVKLPLDKALIGGRTPDRYDRPRQWHSYKSGLKSYEKMFDPGDVHKSHKVILA